MLDDPRLRTKSEEDDARGRKERFRHANQKKYTADLHIQALGCHKAVKIDRKGAPSQDEGPLWRGRRCHFELARNPRVSLHN